jgi:hypothetical protein
VFANCSYCNHERKTYVEASYCNHERKTYVEASLNEIANYITDLDRESRDKLLDLLYKSDEDLNDNE